MDSAANHDSIWLKVNSCSSCTNCPPPESMRTYSDGASLIGSRFSIPRLAMLYAEGGSEELDMAKGGLASAVMSILRDCDSCSHHDDGIEVVGADIARFIKLSGDPNADDGLSDVM